MNIRNRTMAVMRGRGAFAVRVFFWASVFVVAPLLSVRAGEAKTDGDKRGPAGTSAGEQASLVRRSAGEKDWHLVDQKETIKSGDLILGLTGGMINSQNGAARIAFTGDLDNLSPFAIIESAVVLHENPGADLDFTLDRGRVEVVNLKESGAAHVKLRVRNESWDFTLAEPGTALAVVLHARWPRGVPFQKEPDAKHVPTAFMVMCVVKGNVAVKHGGVELALSAPPGPALIAWDSVADQDEAPQRLEKLPAWTHAGEPSTLAGKKKKETLDRFRASLLSKGIGPTLDEFIASKNQVDRRLAVLAMGALDDLDRLRTTLREAKHLDVWEEAVVALRHWIGRAPGQDQILYKRLTEISNYKPVHAETVLQLLHSFGDDELAHPETYQTLIDYLNSEALAIRGLAHWHLYRLVPAGREIEYNPLDPKEKRLEAIEKWRKLIPKGTVPPRPKAPEKKG